MPVRNLFVIALTTILSMTCYSTASRNRYANLFAEAVQTIETQALQNVPRQQLFAYAMDGMTSRLDGHSRYISGEMFKIFNEDLKQEFGGVGMYVDTDPATERLTVLAPIPDTPAFKAGIQAGDVITEISGKPTQDLTRFEAVELIRGPRGEPVDIVVERRGQPIAFTLKREFIHEPSVHGDYRQPDGNWNFHLKDYPRVGYIRLLQFGNKSSLEMRDAIDAIKDEVDALIFDLRNNTGGVLDGAVEICDLFLEPGQLIVSTRGRNNKLLSRHVAGVNPVFPADKPVVVLVNRESASASEIVAACLQDHQRAFVGGESTWGKGTVQNVIPMQRGRSALKLTTASYWRPSGHYIDRFDEQAKTSGVWGVQPDSELKLELSEDEIFKNRRRRSLLDLRGLVDPQDLIDRDEEVLIEAADRPLQQAIDFLMKQLDQRAAA